MNDRNRAWRRRQGRKVMAKIRDTKNWLSRVVTERLEENRASKQEVKPHAHGKLTYAQKLRLNGQLSADIADAA